MSISCEIIIIIILIHNHIYNHVVLVMATVEKMVMTCVQIQLFD